MRRSFTATRRPWPAQYIEAHKAETGCCANFDNYLVSLLRPTTASRPQLANNSGFAWRPPRTPASNAKPYRVQNGLSLSAGFSVLPSRANHATSDRQPTVMRVAAEIPLTSDIGNPLSTAS